MSTRGSVPALLPSRHGAFLAAFALLAVLLLALSPHAAAGAPLTERVSISSAGVQGDGVSSAPSISADGRYVAYSSRATNLVGGDTNGSSDIFVRDRVTGTTTRVSVSSTGVQGDGDSYWPSISADGRHVAFFSNATNLVDGDTNGDYDVFVHDRVTGTTTRVSVSSAGAQGDGASLGLSLSADGRYVAFESYATNLVDGDTNGDYDVFVHDRVTGTTTRVSVSSTGAQGDGESYGPSLSADGRYVAYFSRATNLVGGDTNGSYDVFVHDRVSGTTTRVSVSSAGAQGDGDSSGPSLSADGRYVAYFSRATNLVGGDTNGSSDVFVYDRVTGTTTRVSVSSAGAQGDLDSTNQPFISADGRFVAFRSDATNLVGGDTNGNPDVFVRDRVGGTTTRVSVSSAGAQGDLDSSNPCISADGWYVAFSSRATNLVGDDTNGIYDVFVRQALSPAASATRVWGTDRYSTSVELAKAAFPGFKGVKYVVIASGEDRAAADPLAAAGLCGVLDAPLLLVHSNGVPGSVAAAIGSMPDGVTVIVVGGRLSVPSSVSTQLAGIKGVKAVQRVDGSDRYALARSIAERMKAELAKQGRPMPAVALLANGADPETFFDALALSAVSANNHYPILLLQRDGVPAPTAAALAEHKFSTRIIGGGPRTVTERVRTTLGATRWYGTDRYATAAEIAKQAVVRNWALYRTTGVASAMPDALTGGSSVGVRSGVLLLARSDRLPPITAATIKANRARIAELTVLGGPLSITDGVRTQLTNLLK